MPSDEVRPGGLPAPDPQPMLESLYLQHRVEIDEIVTRTARRAGLRKADEDDLRERAHLKIIGDGYAVLAKFRGDSKLSTYLTVIIRRCLLDFVGSNRTRWRPSRKSVRAGALAVSLDRCIYRWHLTLAQAGMYLRSAGKTDKSDRDLAALLKTIRRREIGPPDEVFTDERNADNESSNPESDYIAAEDEAEQQHVSALLREIRATLSPEDQRILMMRYEENMSITDIARVLDIDPPRPLFRRLERLHALLLERLTGKGGRNHG